MGHAWIDGRPVALQAAIAEAARLLGASRVPVVAGLGTDIAGARAAIALAARLGAAIDHMHSHAVLGDVDVMREFLVEGRRLGDDDRKVAEIRLIGEIATAR